MLIRIALFSTFERIQHYTVGEMTLMILNKMCKCKYQCFHTKTHEKKFNFIYCFDAKNRIVYKMQSSSDRSEQFSFG